MTGHPRQHALPDAAWIDDPVLAALIGWLGGAEVTRVVGGAVRDTLAGIAVADIDLATCLLPEEVARRVTAAGAKAVPTGLAHGTVTAVVDGQPFEVTTLRRDVSTDGRRATVAFTQEWAEDAARRDFTINALYADPAARCLFDYHGGVADLAAGHVRFIGDAAARIDEDHLRILRWFRFSARFAHGAPDPALLALLAQKAPTLRGLSRERVADELLGLLALADPAPMLALMREAAVLAEVVPEAVAQGPERVAALVAAEQAAGIAGDGARRLAALLGPDAALADTAAARLKLSNRLRKRLSLALGPTPETAPHPLAYRLGCEGATDQLLLAGRVADARTIDGWVPPRLPVSGGDIVAAGVSAGPDVARLLRRVESAWLERGCPDRAATLPLIAALKDG